MTKGTTLERLSALSKVLNEASDKLSKQVTGIEGALNALHLGVHLWIEVVRETEMASSTDSEGKKHLDEFTHIVLLGYTKKQGEWGLWVADGYEEFMEGDELGEITRLRDAKRDVKLVAIERIPVLLQKIEARATELAEEADLKARQLEDISGTISKNAR